MVAPRFEDCEQGSRDHAHESRAREAAVADGDPPPRHAHPYHLRRRPNPNMERPSHTPCGPRDGEVLLSPRGWLARVPAARCSKSARRAGAARGARARSKSGCRAPSLQSALVVQPPQPDAHPDSKRPVTSQASVHHRSSQCRRLIAAGENPHYLTFHRHGTPRVRTIWALRRLAPQAQRNALLGLDSYARCARCAPQYGQKHPRLSAGVGGPRRGRVERE